VLIKLYSMASLRVLSKVLRLMWAPALPCFIILQFVNNAGAQGVSVGISLPRQGSSTIHLDVRYSQNSGNAPSLYFLKSYAGVENLANRISALKAFDSDNKSINIKQLIPGEYVAEQPYTRVEYDFDAAPLTSPAAAAHASWISGDRGLLFADDLFPQFGETTAKFNVQLTVESAPDWQIFTTEKSSQNVFQLADTEKAVLVLSRKGSVRQFKDSCFGPSLYLEGNWTFSDEDVAGICKEVFEYYNRQFPDPPETANVYLLHFPIPASAGAWEADTRGNSTVIISSEMPFKTQSLQRLHEQLRHELFHLWVPNRLSLSGIYDWFYEGFALYISLKQGVAENRLRFDDFLDTLARAYTIENFQQSGISLIQASKERWSGSNTRVYARGMLVAFLSDLAMLQKSRGKYNVEKLVKDLIDRHGSKSPPVDGNEAVLNIMASKQELTSIVEKYIKGSQRIDWREDLIAAGIEPREENQVTRLFVVTNPRGRQKEILEILGYNNWRKPVSK
jgi:predicted metalloprotease with PDZ domain